MRKTICLILSFCILSAGCGGRIAYPIQITQPEDYRRSCMLLESEIVNLQTQIRTKMGAVGKTNTDNAIGLGVGLLLFWPALFFMDLSNADQVELEALRGRYNHLQSIYASNGC